MEEGATLAGAAKLLSTPVRDRLAADGLGAAAAIVLGVGTAKPAVEWFTDVQWTRDGWRGLGPASLEPIAGYRISREQAGKVVVER